MKRFTETTKWRDPWFRKLTLPAKGLFLWLVDHCDNAGVIDLDIEAASFDIGEAINEYHVAEIESRFKRLPSGKLHLPKFIPFQYGTLSDKCTPHLRVLETLRSHGLSYPLLAILSTTLVPTLGTTLGTRVQEKKGKEQDKKGRGQEGVQGEGAAAPTPKFLKPGLADLQLHCAKIGLPETEAERFWNYHESKGWVIGKVPMKSWTAALATWKGNYQKFNAETGSANGKPAATVFGLKTVLEAKTKLADELKNRHSTTGPLSTDWDDPRYREEYLKLRGEIKTVTRQLAGMA